MATLIGRWRTGANECVRDADGSQKAKGKSKIKGCGQGGERVGGVEWLQNNVLVKMLSTSLSLHVHSSFYSKCLSSLSLVFYPNPSSPISNYKPLYMLWSYSHVQLNHTVYVKVCHFYEAFFSLNSIVNLHFFSSPTSFFVVFTRCTMRMSCECAGKFPYKIRELRNTGI